MRDVINIDIKLKNPPMRNEQKIFEQTNNLIG